MAAVTIQSVISRPEYAFLQENAHLGKNVLFVTFGGSHAYGTADDFSDIDLRGCTLNTASDLLGMSTFETFRNREFDTTIHSLFKLAQLLLKGDMVAAELLGCKPEQYAMVSPVGAQFLENRNLFFTQKISNAYTGYTHTLLKWLQTASLRLHSGNQPGERDVMNACQSTVEEFGKLGGEARLYLEKSEKPDMTSEVFMDINVQKRPMREYISMLSALQNIVATQANAAEHRRILDDRFIAKKMYTLLRMLYTCCELHETGKLTACREKELAQLIEVRDGRYSDRNGIAPEYWALVEPLLERMDYAKQNTVLPEDPDMRAVNDLIMELNRQAL